MLVHQFENTEDFQKTRATDKCCAISRMKIHNKTFDIGKMSLIQIKKKLKYLKRKDLCSTNIWKEIVIH